MTPRSRAITKRGQTCCQQLGNLALHEAELADKDIQDPAQLQPVGVCSGSISVAGKHDFHYAVQQLDAGALGGHWRVGVLQVPAQTAKCPQECVQTCGNSI